MLELVTLVIKSNYSHTLNYKLQYFREIISEDTLPASQGREEEVRTIDQYFSRSNMLYQDETIYNYIYDGKYMNI